MKFLIFTIFLLFTSCFDNNARKKEINHLLNSINWVFAENNWVDPKNRNYEELELISNHSFVKFRDTHLMILDTTDEIRNFRCGKNFGVRGIEIKRISRNSYLFKKEIKSEIIKINQDSLIIHFKNNPEFKFSNQIITFYNEKLKYDKNIRLDSIFFATGLCYQNCVSFFVKLSRDSMDFYAAQYLNKKGYYKAKTNKDYFLSLQDLVRNINQKTIPQKYYSPIDLHSSRFRMILYYNKHYVLDLGFDMDNYPQIVSRVAHKLLEIERHKNLIHINNQKLEDNFYESNKYLITDSIFIIPVSRYEY